MLSTKVLITGASGVIGSALKTELSAQYSNVVSISSSDADLASEEQTQELFEHFKPEIVYHLAARVYGIMGNLQNKGKAFTDNVRINTNVIDSSYKCGAKKVVAMGSSAIYSDDVTLPMSEEDIWKGPPHSSEAAYAHSKRAMLAQLTAYHEQYGLDYAFCVSTNLYGPNDKFDERWGHVIPSLISKFYRASTEEQDIMVWGDGSPKRDFLFSADAARAMRMIGQEFTGAINLATGEAHAIREAVDLLANISGFKGQIHWDSSKPNGQNLRGYNVSKLKDIGFQPQYSLASGLQKTYEWYRDNIAVARK